MGNVFSSLSSAYSSTIGRLVGWKMGLCLSFVLGLIKVYHKQRHLNDQEEKQKEEGHAVVNENPAEEEGVLPPEPIRVRFLYFGDFKSIAFAPLQLALLSYVVGKMLNPKTRFPLPLPTTEFFTYLTETFGTYALQTGRAKDIKTFLEALLNGETKKVDPSLLALIAKIGLGFGIIKDKVNQITLPVYFFYSVIFRGKDACDIKAEGGEEAEGLVSFLSLVYHCFVTLSVMIFGSVALMQSDDLGYMCTQFLLAVMLTDFEELKNSIAAKHIDWLVAFLDKIRPTIRTLELKPTSCRKTYDNFEETLTYGNLGACALVQKIVPAL